MRRARLIAGAEVALMLVVPSGVWGAAQGIGVSPTSQDLSLAAGESYPGQITVINDGDRDVTYKIFASDYRVDGETYVGDFSSSLKQADVSPVSWFTLPKGNFVVKSHVENTFNYTIQVPPSATVGGHYGAIFIETVPPPGAGAAIVSRIERIGSLFYLTTKGTLNRSGSLLGLNVARLQAVGPVLGSLRLRNDGNVHYLADGTATLTPLFGSAGKAIIIHGEVLPGTIRRFDLKLPAPAPLGIYNVSASIKYLDHTENVSKWMLLMPKLTFLILGGTLMLLLGVAVSTWIRRSRKRRAS